MHFFNPAPVMRLVEVVAAVQTDPATTEAVTGLVRSLGKTPVSVTDRAGFVANALLLPYLNHAVSLLAAGYATREDIDAAAGEIHLGPAVRQPDGSIRRYGRAPAKGEQLRIRSYATGGGRGGNVSRGAISVLKSSIPYVARVENRQAARGGVDGEDLANAKERGPIQLRTRARAVTSEDFEQISREAAPEVFSPAAAAVKRPQSPPYCFFF